MDQVERKLSNAGKVPILRLKGFQGDYHYEEICPKTSFPYTIKSGLLEAGEVPSSPAIGFIPFEDRPHQNDSLLHKHNIIRIQVSTNNTDMPQLLDISINNLYEGWD